MRTQVIALIGVLVIGVFDRTKATAAEIIWATESRATPDVILVAVDNESTEEKSRLAGAAPIVLHPLVLHVFDSQRIKGHRRTLFPEDVGSCLKTYTPNEVGAFKGLQWSQYPVVDILNLDVALNDFSPSCANIRDHVSDFNVLLGLRSWEHEQFADNKFGPMRRGHGFLRDVEAFADEPELPIKQDELEQADRRQAEREEACCIVRHPIPEGFVWLTLAVGGISFCGANLLCWLTLRPKN